MKKFESYSRFLTWFMALLLVALAAGCGGGGGGGRDPILGTGATATQLDSTRPRVVSTIPANAAVAPLNTLITTLFTEEMARASIEAAGTVTVACSPLCIAPTLAGTASYAVGSRTAVFTPTPAGTPLEAGKTYTVTITTAATDATPLANALAGNQAPLPAASAYIWSFTTAAPIPPANITVASVFPADGAGGICPTSAISATFTVPDPLLVIDPLTVTPATFIVTGPGPATPLAVVGGLRSTPLGLTSTFTPDNPLAPGTYTVRIVSGAAGVKDTAIPGDQLLADRTWTFTVIPAGGVCLAPIPLGTASTFGALSCAAITGSAAGTGTTVNGNIGTRLTSTSVTGWVGGGAPATPGIVNGTIFASDLPAAGNMTSTIAVADAYTAFLAAQTVGASGAVIPTSDLGALAGFGPNPLTPGTFKAGAYTSGSSIAISTPLTLDAQGDANAVWVFYSPSSTLTTTGPLGNIILANNAQAKNVFWVVGSSAILGAPLFSGNILAATSISVSNIGGILDGRALTSGPTCAAVTFAGSTAGTVNVPLP
ncbi:MAG: ice-binding family protein [Burkholderiales bacterium]|nr:ice-binding family protein [Burkholderiales bacterium]